MQRAGLNKNDFAWPVYCSELHVLTGLFEIRVFFIFLSWETLSKLLCFPTCSDNIDLFTQQDKAGRLSLQGLKGHSGTCEKWLAFQIAHLRSEQKSQLSSQNLPEIVRIAAQFTGKPEMTGAGDFVVPAS